MAIPLSEAATKGLAPAPGPADVGLVMALPIEAGFLTDSLKSVRKYTSPARAVTEGELGGKLVAMAISGMGREAAARATGLLISGHRPRWIVSAGFAGALDPTLRRNDLLLPDRIIGLDGGPFKVNSLEVEVPGITRAEGLLLTVNRIVTSPAEKAELRARHGADLVDLETLAVARAAAERGLRFLSVRVVSDDAGTELPAEVASILGRSGSYQVGAAMRALWRRPAIAKDFWRLHAQALEASDRLARCLRLVIESLPL